VASRRGARGAADAGLRRSGATGELELVARSLLVRLQREQVSTAEELSDLDRPFSIY
jgi:hypothetical protein